MGGGLMQLVAYGAQDVYLTGNPQITFFKVVYRRHTNFSMECIEQTWSGNSIADGKCTATISRNGDLIHKMHLQLDIGATNLNSNSISDYIDYVEVEIGGQKIDRQSGAYMLAYNEVRDEICGGDDDGFNTLKQRTYGPNLDRGQSKFIPLNFWFCKNAGLALPLIALQYHEVKVILSHTLTTRFTNLPAATTDGINIDIAGDMNILRNTLWVDYIYLDTDERRRFAQVSHEYLIEQVQEQILQGGVSGDHELRFNHPVKELMWFSTFTSGGPELPNGEILSDVSLPVVRHSDLDDVTYTLKLNGHERFSARPHTYFSRVQLYQHHSGDGSLNSIVAVEKDLEWGTEGVVVVSDIINYISDSICIYSFALNPEEHQPSGTCNFSRIDSAVLNTGNTRIASSTDPNLRRFGKVANYQNHDGPLENGRSTHLLTARIVAINYNVLRIMSGMGGLAYSN